MASGLLGPNGKPISSAMLNKKSKPPETGEKFGTWGGPNVSIMQLPGGGAIQFDLNMLTLGDYRQMTDHYQINSSLTVLMFLLHQIEFKVRGGDAKQNNFYEEQLNNIWTPLVRSKATAFWSGFSPNILQWENDTPSRRITLTKIKDLIPEESYVNWKVVDGHREEGRTHKINVYNGIKQFGGPTIPVENSYWYPLLMRHGDMTGTKLLRSAFQPWFFSLLVHLFANRYYERFGEPTPIGRAPYEDEIRFGGTEMRGNQAMELILQQLRSRAAVVLPNDKTPFGDETTLDYDYQIEYLESQMRGADFERYLTRLDEEMSLALFTPILLMRTADVGSYNLGTQHNVTYKMLLNTIFADWKFYIDWYILRPLRDYNFGTNAGMPKFVPRKLGSDQEALINELIKTMVAADKLKPNTEQLGEMAGIDLATVAQLTEPTQAPATGDGEGDPATENGSSVGDVVRRLSDRIEQQVRNGFKRQSIADAEFSLGYQKQFEAALKEWNHPDPFGATKQYYDSIDALLNDLKHVSDDVESFMRAFRSCADWRANELQMIGAAG